MQQGCQKLQCLFRGGMVVVGASQQVNGEEDCEKVRVGRRTRCPEFHYGPKSAGCQWSSMLFHTKELGICEL